MTHQALQEQLTAELCGMHSQPVLESYQPIPVIIIEGTQKKLSQDPSQLHWIN